MGGTYFLKCRHCRGTPRLGLLSAKRSGSSRRQNASDGNRRYVPQAAIRPKKAAVQILCQSRNSKNCQPPPDVFPMRRPAWFGFPADSGRPADDAIGLTHFRRKKLVVAPSGGRTQFHSQLIPSVGIPRICWRKCVCRMIVLPIVAPLDPRMRWHLCLSRHPGPDALFLLERNILAISRTSTWNHHQAGGTFSPDREP